MALYGRLLQQLGELADNQEVTSMEVHGTFNAQRFWEVMANLALKREGINVTAKAKRLPDEADPGRKICVSQPEQFPEQKKAV